MICYWVQFVRAHNPYPSVQAYQMHLSMDQHSEIRIELDGSG